MNRTDVIATFAAAISTYAAIVATAVAALEYRRWFASGPRLSISIIAKATLVEDREVLQKTYVSVSVDNRGNAPTTITHFGLVERNRFYDKWFGLKRKTFIVPRPWFPGSQPNLPSVLEPGHRWAGFGVRTAEIDEWIDSGKAHVLVQASHDNEPTLKRIPKARPVLESAKSI